MSDIIFSEREKRLINISVKTLRKLLGKKASHQYILDEMETCANEAVRNISAIIRENCSHIEEKYQREMTEELSILALWIILHDTAYRDVGFSILDDVLKNATILRKMIRPFVKPFKEWYCNLWCKSKKVTTKQREDDIIPAYEHSIMERQCVPSKLNSDIKKILKGKK